MTIHRLCFSSLICTLAFSCIGVAHSNPAFYISAGIDNALTCPYAVKWDAPKEPIPPGQPAELRVPSVQAPITWPYQLVHVTEEPDEPDTPPIVNIIKDPFFTGERGQYGYDPLFARTAEVKGPNNKATGRVSFAFNGRPIIRDDALNLRMLLNNGQWQTFPLHQVAADSLLAQNAQWSWDGEFGIGVSHDSRVVFDDQCHAYTVVNAYRSNLDFAFLLHSRDGGTSWAAYPLPGWDSGDGDVRMEVPSNSRMTLAEPPVIILHQLEGHSPHRAVLLFPRKNPDGTLPRDANGFLDAVSATVENSICCARHAGNDTQVISHAGNVHFGYPADFTEEVTYPDKPARHGTPQFIKTFSRSSGAQVGETVKLGVGFSGPADAPSDICRREPDNDHPCPQRGRPNPHNQPALAIDGKGYLHVIVGTHSGQLLYSKSSQPNSIASWPNGPTSIDVVAKSSEVVYPDSYSYPSLIVDGNNRPHVFARWSGNSSYENELVHVYRTAENGSWSQQQWLLKPDRSGYTNWYNKAAIDRWGRLFVSYWYYPADLYASEAANFKREWGFTDMCKLYDPGCGENPKNLFCPAMNRGQKKNANYCTYLNYKEVSPGLLISTDGGTTFRLATSAELFSGNLPASPVPPPPRPALDAATRSILLNQ
jgi:hypothetical protein